MLSANQVRQARRIAAVVAILVALVAFVAGRRTSGGPSPATRPPLSRGNGLTIERFAFSPNPYNAKVGDTIPVTNLDGTDHSVTADDHSFDTGHFASGSKTITVSKPGTITFHCDVHTYMTGVIQVGG